MNKRLQFCSVPVLLAAAAGASAQLAANHSPVTGHARLTASESLWTGRFSDCDLRYYLLIPSGFVGHGSRPPAPIHSIVVGLPDTKTDDTVSFNDERFILVKARTNQPDFKSVEQFAERALDYLRSESSGFEIKSRKSLRLNGQLAARLAVEYDGPSGRVTQDEVLALQSGILYEIRLRTTPLHYAADSRQFAKIVNGFRFWTNYTCYGTNNNP